MFSVYDRLLAEDIEEKVQLVERAHQSSQYGEAWRIVNQISGRKKSAIGRISGTCPKERIDKWSNHFKSLLGNPPVSVDVDQDPDIPEVLSDLSIEDGPFSEEEYTRVKNAVKLGKSAGPENGGSQVLRTRRHYSIILQSSLDRRRQTWAMVSS